MMDQEREDAKKTVAAWARYANDGALRYPGPDAGGRSSEDRIYRSKTDEQGWRIVEDALHEIGERRPWVTLRALLVHVFLYGEDPATFKLFSIPAPGEDGLPPVPALPFEVRRLGLDEEQLKRYAIRRVLRAVSAGLKRWQELEEAG